jgi:DNA processing protein
VRAGYTVASGLARGIDAAAHEGALDGGGATVAVLGSGLDCIYPRDHLDLSRRIVEAGGALLSEYPPGTGPVARHFPLRNRIISGLCCAVVVVEASKGSGSLITARLALEQGREVLAVPGSVLSGKYEGCHALIKDGAALVETVEDVLDQIGGGRRAATVRPLDTNLSELSELEAGMAPGEAYSLDDLAARTRLATDQLLAEVGRLELAGRLLRVPGGGFVRLDNSAIGGRDG